jgi:L-ascorbate metabolism protein UlaG (beta-lactamase superfamily)
MPASNPDSARAGGTNLEAKRSDGPRATELFPGQRARLTFLGHSTVLIEMGGTRILTDPALGHVMWSLRRHSPPVSGTALEGIDAVYISHGHFDHLDLPSLRSLPGRPEVVVPRGLGHVVAAARLGVVHEVAPGDRFRIGGIDIEVVAAAHGRHRLPWVAGVAATGCLLSSADFAIYFAGDTDLFPTMADSPVAWTWPYCRSAVGDSGWAGATWTLNEPQRRRR